jgi:dipeptidyl aminopeptidase/acylaminoacyl peptidase
VIKRGALFLLLIAIACPAPAQQKEPITHEALWLMPRVGSPAPSPDGKWVAFSVTEPAYDEKDQSSDLWIVAADGSGQPRRLTSTKAGESGVIWSPDSAKIAFVAKREGDENSQIYVLDLADGGEAMRMTSLSTGAGSAVWRPDGRAILFTSRVYADQGRAEELKKRKYTVREFETFPIRRWDHWLDDRQVHLFVQSLEPEAKPIDLLAGTKLVQSPGYRGRDLDNGEALMLIEPPDELLFDLALGEGEDWLA